MSYHRPNAPAGGPTRKDRTMKTRPGFRYPPNQCPNGNHLGPVAQTEGGQCAYCGADVKAFRLGRRLAPWLTLAVVIGLVAIVVILLTGCTNAPARETPAEAAYLNAMHSHAKDAGVLWSGDFQAAVLEVGKTTCAALGEGRTLDTILARSEQDTATATAMVRLAIETAATTLCPMEAE